MKRLETGKRRGRVYAKLWIGSKGERGEVERFVILHFSKNFCLEFFEHILVSDRFFSFAQSLANNSGLKLRQKDGEFLENIYVVIRGVKMPKLSQFARRSKSFEITTD